MKSLHKFVNKIKIGISTNSSVIILPLKKEWLKFIRILYAEGYIQNYKVVQNKLYIYYRLYQGKNILRTITTFSNKKIYLKKRQIWRFSRYGGTLFISTIFGIKTHTDCLKLGIGGKILFFAA